MSFGTHRTLANEEPNVISVALRPGMVDTGVSLTLSSEHLGI